MTARNRIGLYVVLGLLTIGIIVVILGPVLFASVAYPLPEKHRASLAKWTNEYCTGIATPNFLAALIMTESGWKEGARSYAGAIGMTQFIPSTANAVAKRLGVTPFTPNDLTTNADMSIRFGAYYICTRIQDYGGNVRKGLIAYNGGGGAVLAYERGTPITSTLGYADKILKIEKAYDTIYGEWWKQLDAAGSGESFEIQPKSDISLLLTIPILDFWRGLLSAPVSEAEPAETESESTGGAGNIWQFFLPGN